MRKLAPKKQLTSICIVLFPHMCCGINNTTSSSLAVLFRLGILKCTSCPFQVGHLHVIWRSSTLNDSYSRKYSSATFALLNV